MSPAGLPPDDESPSGGFLNRWSRLKRRPEPEQQPAAQVLDATPRPEPDQVPSPDQAPATASPAPDPVEAERQSILASLPSIESITATTDVSGFMHHLVPHAIRNAALRAAWTADPTIRDFLNDARDYALDYNTPGMAPGYGPLTESDDVQAMIGQIFGRPVDKSLTFLPEEPGETPCGSESQSDVAEDNIASQQFMAAKQELVSIRRSNRSDTIENLLENPDGSGMNPDVSADAALQRDPHDMTLSHSNAGASRRRGGRATPV